MKKINKISSEEREQIALMKAQGFGVRAIAKNLGRSPSSVSDELKRNGSSSGEYSAFAAQTLSEKRNSLSRKKNPLKSPEILAYTVRKLREGWSPEQIAGRLKKRHHKTVVCHETIYNFCYSQKGKALGLYEYLPRKHRKRYKWYGRSVYHRGIPNRVSIHDRPEVINQRKQFGHWEMDTVEGKAHKAGLVTALERVSRFYDAEQIPNIDSEYGVKAQKKIFEKYPRFARKTATFDNGKENYNHEELRRDLQIDTYFCDPNNPGQRGSNEHHNGLIRRYIPKKTDLTTLYPGELKAILTEINNRPRKCLNYSTPKEVFMYYLNQRKASSVRIRTRM